MKNSILRELFKRLATAPEIVANDYLNELSGHDREEAERLIKALKIKIGDVKKWTLKNVIFAEKKLKAIWK